MISPELEGLPSTSRTDWGSASGITGRLRVLAKSVSMKESEAPESSSARAVICLLLERSTTGTMNEEELLQVAFPMKAGVDSTDADVLLLTVSVERVVTAGRRRWHSLTTWPPSPQ